MPGFVLDEVPSSLVRAFSEGWHRQAFLAGNVRLKHIAQFRSSADPREDRTEGHSYIRVPGQVPRMHLNPATLEVAGEDRVEGFFNRQSEFLNPTYLHSASGPDVDRLRLAASFGSFLVEITKPDVFFQRLFDAALAHGIPNRDVNFLDTFPVQYTKGDVQAEPADISALLRLDYGQKPADCRWQSEYRAVLSFSGPLHSYPDCLTLKLGDLSDIARPV